MRVVTDKKKILFRCQVRNFICFVSLERHTMSTTEKNGEEIVTYSELLEQIDDEEAELDRERALYGNCDTDTCTYSQVNQIELK